MINELPYVLHQDNAWPHTFIRDCFTRNHLIVMAWSSASPVLNGLENVGKNMKDRLKKKSAYKYHKLENYNHGNVDWGLDQNYTDSLVDFMQRRNFQCLERHKDLIISFRNLNLSVSIFIDLFYIYWFVSKWWYCCKLNKKKKNDLG